MPGFVDGVAPGVAQPLWSIVKPLATTNLVTNPSFEVDTAGWTATSATFIRQIGVGLLGSYGAILTASAQNGRAEYSGPQYAGGTLVVASAWVWASSPLVVLRLAYGGVTVDQAHPGDSAWHRLSVATTAVAATTPVIGIRDGRASSWVAVYVDGVQFETGVSAATDYCDGTQDGCTWTGAPHASTSIRDGRDGRSGQLVSLDSIGVLVTAMPGIGAPDVDVTTQALAFGDGAIYQRSAMKPRVLTLAALLIGDGTTAGLHTVRRGLSDLLKPDIRSGRGPITLRYAGSSVPKRLSAYYEDGFGWGDINGMAEKTALRFLAPDPFWYRETDQQASIAINQTLTGVGMLALYDGANWSNMGGSATAVTNTIVDAVRLLDGRIVVAGNFTNMGGVTGVNHLAIWDGTTWSSPGGVAPNAQVRSIWLSTGGNLVVGGDFTAVGAVANTSRIALWTASANTWTALGTGANGVVKSVMVRSTEGAIWAAGDFTTMGGVSTPNGAAYWNGGWVNASSGFPAIAGNIDHLNEVNGRVLCAVNGAIYLWDDVSAWTLFTTSNGFIYQLKTFNGFLFAAGSFTTITGTTGGAVAANRIAYYNNYNWIPMSTGASTGSITTMAYSRDGRFYIGGNWQGGTVSGVLTSDSLAFWDGANWQAYPVIDPPNTATHTNDTYQVWTFSDGRILIGWQAASGTFGTTMTIPGLVTGTSQANDGSTNAYPVIDFISATANQVSWIRNLTTGQYISFANCLLAAGETATLDLRPGRKTFTTPTRSLLSTVTPGSSLSTFALAPGTNALDAYATSGSVILRWRPADWSAD
jgi:hypothetical protein